MDDEKDICLENIENSNKMAEHNLIHGQLGQMHWGTQIFLQLWSVILHW